MSGRDARGMTELTFRAPVAIAEVDPAAARKRRLRIAAGGAVAVLLAVEGFLVAPTLEEAATSLANVDAVWSAVAILAVAMSMVMFALTRRRLLLAAGIRASVRDSVEAALVANSLHATLPGGPAFSTAYNFRWMRGAGASSAVATWCLVAGGLVSTASLGVVALMAAVLVRGRGSWDQLAVEAAGLVAAGLAVRWVMRRPHLLVTAGQWVLRRVNRLRRRPVETGVEGLGDLVTQLGTVRPTGRDWVASTGLALLNWAFDAACLAACAAALGVHGVTLPLLLVAFTAGMSTSGLSPLPGGLGVVDAALVLTFVAGGIPAAQALPAVVLYRLISLVGVVAAGWVVCAARQVRPWHSADTP